MLEIKAQEKKLLSIEKFIGQLCIKGNLSTNEQVMTICNEYLKEFIPHSTVILNPSQKEQKNGLFLHEEKDYSIWLSCPSSSTLDDFFVNCLKRFITLRAKIFENLKR